MSSCGKKKEERKGRGLTGQVGGAIRKIFDSKKQSNKNKSPANSETNNKLTNLSTAQPIIPHSNIETPSVPIQPITTDNSNLIILSSNQESSEDQNQSKMAVFKKFLSTTKNKMKTNNTKGEKKEDEEVWEKRKEEDGGTWDVDEEFENRKQEWQEELDQMSDFLVLKSTEEQKEEGVENPVDTAYLDFKGGLPVLKACFDVQHFKPDEVQLNVDNGMLTLFAQCLEERDVAVFKKTMIRKMELPRHVNEKMVTCVLSEDRKVLVVEMPFHLPPQKKSFGPTVLPVINEEGGKKKIRLSFNVGKNFNENDLLVFLNEEKKCLTVEASYEETLGFFGIQTTRRQFRKTFQLPDLIKVEKVEHHLKDEGCLWIDIVLKEDPGVKFKVSVGGVSKSSGQSNSVEKGHESYTLDKTDLTPSSSPLQEEDQLNKNKTKKKVIDEEGNEDEEENEEEENEVEEKDENDESEEDVPTTEL